MNKYQPIVEKLPTFPGEELSVKAKSEKALSEDQLDKVERDIGFSLPEDYREFLKFYGDLSVICAIEFPKDGEYPEYGGCEYFFGVEAQLQWNNIITYYRNRGDGWPANFLPITTSDNGEMCIVLDGEERGAIYFLYAGEGASGIVVENFYFVAKSFDAFIHMLN